MILTSNWDFGIGELIQVIAACCTLFAVIVSLYLANRARRVKKKVIVTEDGVVRIVNVGDSKFTISALGYVIDDTLFFNENQEYIKPLSEGREIFKNSTAHWDKYFSNVVLEPGDCVETKICIHKNGDPKFIKCIFIVINYKLYFFNYKFKKLMMISEDTMHSCNKNSIFSCFN